MSLVQAGFGTGDGNVHTWPTKHIPQGGGEWYLYPIDKNNNTYYIFNMNSGMILVQEAFGVSKNKRNAHTWWYDKLGGEENGHIWQLKREAGGTRIINMKTKQGLVQSGFGDPNDGNVLTWPTNDINKEGGGLWNVEWSETTIRPYTTKPFSRVSDPIMNSHSKPQSPQRTGVLATDMIPCFMVKDPKYSTFRMKIEKSPWYYLNRSITYVLEPRNYFRNTSAVEVTKTTSYTNSWTEEQQSSFSITTGIEVSAGGEAFGGSVTSKLEMTSEISNSLSKTTENTLTYELMVPANHSFALFTEFDLLTLTRYDKTPVKSWKIGDTFALKTFPRE